MFLKLKQSNNHTNTLHFDLRGLTVCEILNKYIYVKDVENVNKSVVFKIKKVNTLTSICVRERKEEKKNNQVLRFKLN